jgi:hypothetical protein
MAPLTWRNVERGTFQDSVAALRLSGDLLNRGFDRADTALSEFDTWRTEQNDRTALAAASRIQDPRAYRAALESGTALGGIAPTGLSARTLGLLDARSGALTERDAAAYANNRTQTTNAALDAAAPDVAALSDALRRGDSATAARISARMNLAGVPVEQIQRIYAGLGQQEATQANIEGTRASTEGTRVSTQGGRIRNQSAEFDYNTRVREDLDSQGSMRIVDEIGSRARTDADASRLLQEYRENGMLAPGILARVREGLRARGFNVDANAGSLGGGAAPAGGGAPGRAGAAIAGAGGPTGYASPGGPGSEANGWQPGTPSAPGTAGTRQGNPYDATFNFRGTERPITTMTIAEVQEFQRQHRQREGHSPMGAYQINHDTLAQYAPRVLGDDWRNQQFTPDAQERIARAIFNDRRGGDITQTWSALRNVPGANEPGRFRNTSWEEFRGQVSRAEVGQVAGGESPAATVRAGQETLRGIEERRGQNIVDAPLARRYLEAASSTDDLLTVNRRLRENNGPLSHLSEGDAMAFVEDIIGQSPDRRMRPAQAEAIIRASVESQNGFNANPFNGQGVRLNPFGDRVVRPNQTLARNQARSLLEGTTRQAAEVDQELQQQAQAIQVAVTRVETLQQEVRAAEAEVQNGQPRQQSLDRAREQLRAAQTQLQLLRAAVTDVAAPRDDAPRRRGPTPPPAPVPRRIFPPIQ